MKNQRSRVVLRADCGSSIGVGHVFRCLALADMLSQDFDIAFAIRDTSENIVEIIRKTTDQIIFLAESHGFDSEAVQFTEKLNAGDIIVLDGYHFKSDYQKTIKQAGYKLVFIDDLRGWHQFADVVINPAEGIPESSYAAEPYTQLCLGLSYAILRQPFLTNTPRIKQIKKITSVFISMGAGDINNLTKKFAEALLLVDGIQVIHLMIGLVNPNAKSIREFASASESSKISIHYSLSADEIVSLLNECDVCICPASNISVESCAVGIGLISGYTADNQIDNLAGLENKNVLINFGDLVNLSVKEIQTAFGTLVKQPEIFDPLIENQVKLIDKKSPERLRNLFAKLSGNSLHFRMAGLEDVDLYYQWTNDTFTRNNSFSSDTIAYDDHVNWFKSKVNSKDCFLYLFLDQSGEAVGQVRIDRDDKEVVIGISIAEAFRGKSFSVEMLTSSVNDYFSKYPTDTIIAYIKVGNAASYKSFIKAGFGNEEVITHRGLKCYKLYKTSGH